MTSPPAPRLLVLRALGLGDLVTAVPALRALADAFPDHHRALAAPAGLAPLALHTGTVHEMVATPDLDALPPLPPPDVAVNLHGRGPQSHAALVRLRPRRLIAFRCGEVAGPVWRAGEHEVARWCRLLAETGVPADPARLDLDPPRRPVPAHAVGATLVHPGAASPARRWPAPRWAAVARAEADAGRTVVVSGSAAERRLTRAVVAGAGLPASADLGGTSDVLGLAALVAAAGRVVCGDTGVAHLATAFRRPSVVLFGPVPPSEWGPPPDRAEHVVLWAGGRGEAHSSRPDPGLLEISVDAVVAALAGLPELEGARP